MDVPVQLKPMIRNNICLNCDPAGCAANVRRQIGQTFSGKTLNMIDGTFSDISIEPATEE